MSIGMELDHPHKALPMRKTAAEQRIIVLRPKMSEILPHMGTTEALAKRYAAPTQMYPDVEFSSEEMVGIAVVMMVMSRAARNRPTPSAMIIPIVSVFVRRVSCVIMSVAI